MITVDTTTLSSVKSTHVLGWLNKIQFWLHLIRSEGNNPKLAPEDEVFVTSRKRFVMSVINHLYDHYKYNLTEDLKREIEQRVDAVLELEMLLQQVLNYLHYFLMPHEANRQIS